MTATAELQHGPPQPSFLAAGEGPPLGPETVRVHDQEAHGRSLSGPAHLHRRLDVSVAKEEVGRLGKARPDVGVADPGIIGVEVLLDLHGDQCRVPRGIGKVSGAVAGRPGTSARSWRPRPFPPIR